MSGGSKNMWILLCVALFAACPQAPATGDGCGECDDGVECTRDTCDQESGECSHEADDATCAPGQVCDADQGCVGTPACAGAADCDDGNLCTDDSCEPGTGCVNADNSAACDDGNPCTAGDTCSGGVCVPGVDTCGCQQDLDCADREDGDLCNGTVRCADGNCEIDPATVVTCSTRGDTACRHNRCDPATGACAMVSAADGSACDDGDLCTQDDVCLDGACAGTPSDCDDRDLCTVDQCDPASGCSHAQISCDDGDACTQDSCDPATGCGHAVLLCDDADACTSDACDPAHGCTFAVLSCDDADACTADSCDPAHGCASTPLSCDDADLCTLDTCDPASGCVHALLSCDDEDACTTDSCDPLLGCQHVALSCDDQDLCTTDSCDPVSGCSHRSISCSDGNACTADQCYPSLGCYHFNVDCDDGDSCTVDFCDPQSGCQPQPYTCMDDDPCTSSSCDGQGGCDFPVDLAACPPPVVTIGDSESNRGGFLIFPVTLSGPAPEELVLDLHAFGATSPGPVTASVSIIHIATAGEDFASGTYRYTLDDGDTWLDAGGDSGTEVTFPYRGESMLVEIETYRRPLIGFPSSGSGTYGTETMALEVASVVAGLAEDTSDLGYGTILEWVCFPPFADEQPDRCDFRGRYLTWAITEHGCRGWQVVPLEYSGGPVDPTVCSYCDDTTGMPVMRVPDLCSMAESGDLRCRGDVLERCTLVAGCGHVWLIVEDCGDRGGSCDTDQCVGAVGEHACTELGEIRCNGIAPEVCEESHEGYYWWNSYGSMCMHASWYCLEHPEVDVGMADPCDIAQDHNLRCRHGEIEECQLVHDVAYMGCGYRWRPACVGSEPGDPGCPAAACDGGALGDLRCQGEVLERCGQDLCGLYWRPDQACRSCNGLCVEPQPGDFQCAIQTCAPVSADNQRCAGDVIEQCMSTTECGDHWRPVEDCTHISGYTCYPDASHTFCDGQDWVHCHY